MSNNLRFLACFILGIWAITGILYAQNPNGSEQKFLSRTRQLVIDGKRSGEGYFSEDGKKLIFQAERESNNPFYQIYILNLENGDVSRVSPGHGKTTCAYFRWGGYKDVLFASTHDDPKTLEYQKEEFAFRQSGKQKRYSWDYDPMMEIYTSKQDGTQLKNLTNTLGYDAEGAYSPDGNKIVFCSMRDAYPPNILSEEQKKRLEVDPSYFGEVYIMNADGTQQTRLTNWPGYDGGTFFSPDGQRIIFRHFNEEGTVADVFTIKTDGSDLQQMTDFGAMSWAPFYHPTMEYVIFASNKLGFSNFELYIVDTKGEKEPVQVTHTGGFDGLGVFSPDGKKLCWSSQRTANGASQLFISDWDHASALEALKNAPLKKIHNNHKFPQTEYKPTFNAVQGVNSLKIETQAKVTIATSGEIVNISAEKASITAQQLKEKVSFLASDALDGRMTGSKGGEDAAKYIQKEFENIGLKKMNDSYLIPFEFSTGSEVLKEGTNFTITETGKEKKLLLNKEFLPLPLSESGTAQGKLAFVGYGIKTISKEQDPHAYNSYENIDVKGKIVIALTDVPNIKDTDKKQYLRAYADPRYKSMVARDLGAKGIIFVSSNPQKELFELKHDNSLASSGIIAVSIPRKTIDTWLKMHDNTLTDITKKLEAEVKPAEISMDLHRIHSNINITLVRKSQTAFNVVGVIPPANGMPEQYVVVGGHYDHLGSGELSSASLADAAHKNEVHNGADDNASGTATIMELAEYFAQLRQTEPQKFKKGVIFACWSGEELGLVGSSKFLENSSIKTTQMTSYLNFDMVGSLKDNKLVLQGSGSAKEWNKLVEKRNVAAGFDLVIQDDPYVPTDGTSFYLKRIPTLNFFTGVTTYYHTPSDDIDKINFEGMEQINLFAKNLIEDLISNTDTLSYIKVESNKSLSGKRKNNLVYLGTIPDYVAQEKGVKLSGVKANSPAEKAGLKGGDIIVQLADKKVENIYDYTYILDTLEIGKTVKIVINRSGQSIDLNITPGSRE